MNPSIDILDPNQKPDFIIERLWNLLLPWVCVFEYGAGKWRQSLYLARKWIQLQVQDKNSEFLEILKEICTKSHISNISIEKPSEAQNHILEKSFDAFLCIRVLHFLKTQEAEKVIQNMKEHTKIGWYNVLQFFLKQTEHKAEYFFPNIPELENLYHWWKIIEKTEVKITEPSETTNGREMHQIGIIFQKL